MYTPCNNAIDTYVAVLPQQLQYGLETWVVMHEDLRTSPRCRHTFDALVVGQTDSALLQQAAHITGAYGS